jgi:hypothetical protein
MKRLTYEDVVNIFNKNGATLLSLEYKNKKSKLKFICRCGNECLKSFCAFVKTPRCHLCNINYEPTSRKTTYQHIYDFFILHNCKLLTEDNGKVNRKTRIEFICFCGNISSKGLAAFYRYPMCNNCSKERGYLKHCYSYHHVKEMVENTGCELMTLSDNYKDSSSNILIKCKCGNLFETKFQYFIHENKQQCNSCGIKTRSGENAPRWKGGLVSEEEQIRKSSAYVKWRRYVFERDNYTCQCCGDNRGGNLQAHHLLNFSDHPELRLVVDNGITLCDSCHNFNIQELENV